MHINVDAIFKLSAPEKLQLLEDLWSDLASTPSEIPMHDWQKNELDKRKKNLINNPASKQTWEEIKQEARNRYVAKSDHRS